MFKRTKELQSLVNASRKSLAEAESKIKNKNRLIKNQQDKIKALSESELAKENTALYEENKDLRCDVEVLTEFARHIKELAYTQQYGSVINLQNKIKSELDCLNQQI